MEDIYWYWLVPLLCWKDEGINERSCWAESTKLSVCDCADKRRTLCRAEEDWAELLGSLHNSRWWTGNAPREVLEESPDTERTHWINNKKSKEDELSDDKTENIRDEEVEGKDARIKSEWFNLYTYDLLEGVSEFSDSKIGDGRNRNWHVRTGFGITN